jgi:PAS domain S-box-containing protein
MHEHADTLESLQEENERLRARVQDLEQALAERASALAEVAARASQVPYRAIFEKLPVPLVVYRADGLVLDANEQHLGFIGVTREEIVGRDDLLAPPSAQQKGHEASFARAAEGEIVKLPPAVHGAAGAAEIGSDQQIWSETTYVPVQEEGGSRYVVGISLDVTERQRAAEAACTTANLLSSIVDNSTLLIYAKDLQGRYILLNKATARLIQMTWEQVRGKTDHELFSREQADAYAAHDKAVIETHTVIDREDIFPAPNGEPHHFVTSKFPLRDLEGEVYAVASISTDITVHKLAEAENRRLQDEIIRVQEDTLRALSTPLMPIAKGVVVMPLIGNLDRSRAEHVLDTLLSGVVTHKAKSVIVDITGVPVVDDQVASALIRTAQALKLVGAKVVLTGIQPKIAQTLVQLGTSLEGVITKGTLESGIAHVLKP